MARRARQISLKECYEILRLEKGATLDDVKKAYRKRAFELHPDLNPGNHEAGRQFQLLNEAYVALSAMLKTREQPESKKSEKQQAEQKTEKREEKQEQKTQTERESEKASAAYAEQDVLRDLLSDPFARRVFEDIYSELNRKQPPGPEQAPPPPPHREKPAKKPEPAIKMPPPKPAVPLWGGADKTFKGSLKDFFKRQIIDEEQTLRLPAARLGPGRKIRLSIRRGLSEDVSAVEVTLPPDFVVGKPVRLRGLGRRIGPWQGDLYLTIYTE